MFRMEIKTDNAAFADDLHGEVSRILTEVQEQVADGLGAGTCRDDNGNTVGSWLLDTVDEEEDDEDDGGDMPDVFRTYTGRRSI